MDLASTIIAVLVIVALLAGAVYFIWKTKDKGKPSYAVTPKVKVSKEEKAAIRENKKAAKGKAEK